MLTPICRIVNCQTQLIQHFQTCWKQEYLTALREFHKVKGTFAPQTIKVRDVILIHDNSPRASWKVAVIENLIKGSDGYVQASEVRTSSVRTNRPIYKLYPLEISYENDEVVNVGTINNEADDQQCTDDIGEHSPSMKK